MLYIWLKNCIQTVHAKTNKMVKELGSEHIPQSSEHQWKESNDFEKNIGTGGSY